MRPWYGFAQTSGYGAPINQNPRYQNQRQPNQNRKYNNNNNRGNNKGESRSYFFTLLVNLQNTYGSHSVCRQPAEEAEAPRQTVGPSRHHNAVQHEPQSKVHHELLPLQTALNSQVKFQAGRLSCQISEWKKLTSDRTILNTIAGFKLDFYDAPPDNDFPKQLIVQTDEIKIAQDLLQDLLTKQVIRKSHLHPQGYTSNIFLRPKRNGGHRLILNLKNLNEFVEYFHFKMENLQTAIHLTTQNCWFTSLDLSDAYYSVNVHSSHRKYLQFAFEGETYHFTCMANGITSAPRTFTKLMKVPLSQLREKFDMIIMAYLDDILIISHTKKDLVQATQQAFDMFTSLGFAISPTKSVIEPSHQIDFLGFTLDSTTMLVTLIPDKAQQIKHILTDTLKLDSIIIRDFARLVGKLTATLPGNRYGRLFLKHFEWAKSRALRHSSGRYDKTMTMTDDIKNDLRWWLSNIDSVSRPMFLPNPAIVLYTDASFAGWGCYCPDSGIKTGGRWLTEEQSLDINCLELKAVQFALLALCDNMSNCHILVYSDNQTTVVSINKQGSIQSQNCNAIARDIWMWAMSKQLWLSSTHCPGVMNIEADSASRLFNDSTEWMLDAQTFNKTCRSWGKLSIDMFASRLNYQITPYCAWQPDPHAFAIDCFLLDWSHWSLIYAFPPFSLVNRVLQKIVLDQAEAVLVVPNWKTQPWFPRLQHLMIAPPIALPVTPGTLTLPHDPDKHHPLTGRLTLWVCRVSGQSMQLKGFPLR